MKIFDPKFTGSIEFLNTITGNLTVDGTINATIEGTTATASYVSIDDVDGFSTVSQSIASRLYNQEAFSASLDATFATDAQVATAVSALNQATSSYALIADISGSFTLVSSSLSQRVASQELFSSSLDATFATDAQVTTAVSSLNAATSSYALQADISGSFTSVSSSLAQRITDNDSDISDLQLDSGSFSTRVTTVESTVSTLNSATSSYLLNTTDTLTGDLTVTGRITAQEFHTEFVSASIVYESGSTKFGNSLDDIQSMTGSLQVSGSTHYILGGVSINKKTADTTLDVSGSITGLGLRTNSTNTNYNFISRDSAGNALFVQSVQSNSNQNIATFQYGSATVNAGNIVLQVSKDISYFTNTDVGIGTTTPSSRLQIDKSSQTIGGTTPNGALLVSSLTAGNAVLEIGVDPTSLSYLQSRNITSTTPYQLLLNPDGGNVGIGNTLPTYKLDIAGGNLRVASNSPLIDFTDSNNADKAWRINANGADSKFYIQSYNDAFDSGTTRVTVQHSDGNVGIGTTSPSEKLEVSGSIASIAATDPTFKVQGSDVNYQGRMRWNTTGNYLEFLTRYAGTYYTGSLVLDRGNVGISATTPLRKLHVAGTFAVNASTDQYYGVYVNGAGEGADPNILIGDWHNASATLKWSSAGRAFIIDTQYSTGPGTFKITGNDEASTFLLIDTVGRVGIGNTSPDAKLTIGEDSSETNVGYIRLRGHDVYESNIYKTATYGIYMDTDTNAKPIRIDGSAFITGITGYVGIGTTEPGYTLDVNGGSAFRDTLRLISNATNPVVLTWTGTSNGVIDIKDTDTTKIKLLATGNSYINGGNVGIGTTSPVSAANYIFTTTNGTNGSGYITQVNGTTSMYVYSISTESRISEQRALPLVFETNGSEKMRITSGGNVGIGTTTPISDAKLHLANAGAEGLEFAVNITTNTNRILSYNRNTSAYNILRLDASELQFYTNGGGERMRIDSSGNIGIGTTVPGQTFVVQGEIAKYTTTGFDGTFDNFIKYGYFNDLRTGGTGNTNRWIGFDASITAGGGISNVLRVRAFGGGSNNNAPVNIADFRGDLSTVFYGNVGIGTTSPTTKLEVNGGTPNVNSYADGALQISGTSSPLAFVGQSNLNPSLNRWGFKLREANDGDFSIHSYSASSTRILINSSGNVGINTTSPAAKLHIVDTVGAAIVYQGSQRGKMLGKTVRRHTGANPKTDLFTINSFSNANSNLFAVVTVLYVSPVTTDSGKGTASFFIDESNQASPTISSFTYTERVGGGTLSLEWDNTNKILKFLPDSAQYWYYVVDVEYVAFDGASVSFNTSDSFDET